MIQTFYRNTKRSGNDSNSNNNINTDDYKTNVYKNKIILLLNFIVFAMSF